MTRIMLKNRNRNKLVAITATAVAIMLVVGLGTMGAAPFSIQQAPGPTVTSANIVDNTLVSADLRDGQAVRSTDIVDGQVTASDLATNAVTTDKIRDGEVKANDLDPSIIVGGGFGLQVTERSNTVEVPRTRGEFTVSVQCNSDEVVSGGGFAASLSPEGVDPSGAPKESRKYANGWILHWETGGPGIGASWEEDPRYNPAVISAFAECLKVVNEGTAG